METFSDFILYVAAGLFSGIAVHVFRPKVLVGKPLIGPFVLLVFPIAVGLTVILLFALTSAFERTGQSVSDAFMSGWVGGVAYVTALFCCEWKLHRNTATAPDALTTKE